MNETPNPNPEVNPATESAEAQNSGDQATGNAEAGPKTQERGSAWGRLRSALNSGADEARRQAEEAAPKIKAAFGDAVYFLGYGISFGAVFSFVVAKELTPAMFKKGCREGAAAGESAADRVSTDLRQRSDDAAAPGSTGSGHAPQTGAA